MSTTNPITPPPELVQEWIDEPQYMTEDQLGKRMNLISMNEVKFREIIDKISQYSADHELEACCKLLELSDSNAREFLTAARRLKPPTLKEQALAALQEAAYMADDAPPQGICSDQIDVIRRALEALPND